MNSSLLAKYYGAEGKQALLEALMAQPLVQDEDLAAHVVKRVRLEEIARGAAIIHEGSAESDFFFILDGEFQVMVAGHVIAVRRTGEHVGELAMADPSAPRTASVVAARDSLVARISEAEFSGIAVVCPRLWRRVALELAKVVRAEDEAMRHGAGHAITQAA